MTVGGVDSQRLLAALQAPVFSREEETRATTWTGLLTTLGTAGGRHT